MRYFVLSFQDLTLRIKMFSTYAKLNMLLAKITLSKKKKLYNDC